MELGCFRWGYGFVELRVSANGRRFCFVRRRVVGGGGCVGECEFGG